MVKDTSRETFDVRVRPRKKTVRLVLLLISYVVLGLIVWQVTRSHTSAQALNLTPEQAQKEVNAVVKKVGKIMVLPANEMPQVAIIDNAESVRKSQDIFADVENGDKVLVYQQAKKAIIYRESTDQIVNVIANIGPVEQQPQAEPEPVVDDAATTTQATSTSTN